MDRVVVCFLPMLRFSSSAKTNSVWIGGPSGNPVTVVGYFSLFKTM